MQDLRQGSVAAVQESEEAREDAQHLIRKLLRCLHQRRKGNFSFIMFWQSFLGSWVKSHSVRISFEQLSSVTYWLHSFAIKMGWRLDLNLFHFGRVCRSFQGWLYAQLSNEQLLKFCMTVITPFLCSRPRRVRSRWSRMIPLRGWKLRPGKVNMPSGRTLASSNAKFAAIPPKHTSLSTFMSRTNTASWYRYS